MPIILARTAGFCYGVRRAVRLALGASEGEDSRLVTFGPLVHNQQAIDLLKSRGVQVAESLEEIDGTSRVLIRAHGVTPEDRNNLVERGADICDATCPHVTAAQRIVRRHADNGYACIIIGDLGHAEVEGLLGCAGDRGYVVENERHVQNLPPLDKVCIVSQTTQEERHFERLSARILEKYPQAAVFNTICNATEKRQRELINIAGKSDLVVVVGGRSSANTKRLVKISRGIGTPTIHVETADELPLEGIKPRQVIGITAGASTPHWVIRNVVETIADYQLKRRSVALRMVAGILQFIIFSSILLSVGAGALCFAATELMGISWDSLYAFLAFFFVLSMHLINKRLTLPKYDRLLYGSQKRFARYKDGFTILAVASIMLSLVTALLLGKTVFSLILLSIILGLVYSITLLPKKFARHMTQRMLMDIPGSKDIFMALAWGMVVVLVPYLVGWESKTLGFVFTFFLVILLVFIRSILLDVRDLEGDICLGKETLPILLGSERSQYLIRMMLVMIFLVVVLGRAMGIFPGLSLWLLLLLPYLSLHYFLSRRQVLYQSLLYDAFLEGQFILAGLVTLTWMLFIK